METRLLNQMVENEVPVPRQRRTWLVILAFLVLLLPNSGSFLFSQQQPAPPPSQAPAPPPGQAMSPQQLDDLVAPIALYPDPLLGQILAASTYPLELTEAGQWLQQYRGLQGKQLTDAARKQNWDPSIQALVAFPESSSVLRRTSGGPPIWEMHFWGSKPM